MTQENNSTLSFEVRISLNIKMMTDALNWASVIVFFIKY
jgi:hypothetical protein